MSYTKKKKIKTKKEERTEVLQRLAQAAVEGLAMEVAMNVVMPGSGLALNSLKYAKNAKKAAKVMGKGAAKEGVQMLDKEDRNKTPAENLAEDVGLEFLSRAGSRSA